MAEASGRYSAPFTARANADGVMSVAELTALAHARPAAGYDQISKKAA
jgi:hypothetical protein